MSVTRKTQYCKDVSSFQTDLQIQCNANQNPRTLSCSKSNREKQKIQNNQLNINGEEQRRLTPHNLSTQYKASVIVMSEKNITNSSLKQHKEPRKSQDVANSSLTKREKSIQWSKDKSSIIASRRSGHLPACKRKKRKIDIYLTFHKT